MSVPVILILYFLALFGCSHKGGNAGGAAQSAHGAAPPPPVVVVTDAVRKTVPIYQEFIGQTEAVNTVEIRSQVNGFLKSIDFKEGSTVQKGQLLFEIDPRQYQAALEQALGKLGQANAVLNNDEKNLERDRILFKKQVIARETLDTASAQVEEDRANVKAAQATVDQARLNLGYTKIYAPITGRIGTAQVKVGGLVQQGTTLLDTIYSIDPIYVNFSVTEQTYLSYAEMVAKADHAPPLPPVELLLPNNRVYSYQGKIDMSTPAVSTSTGTLGVRAVFPNPEGILRAGLFVRVRLMVREDRNAVVIPVQAIQEVQGQQHVLIVGPDNKVEIRPITAGATVGNLRIVTSSIQPGEHVIVEGVQKARPGMVVNAEMQPPPNQTTVNQPNGNQPAMTQPAATQPAAPMPSAVQSPRSG